MKVQNSHLQIGGEKALFKCSQNDQHRSKREETNRDQREEGCFRHSRQASQDLKIPLTSDEPETSSKPSNHPEKLDGIKAPEMLEKVCGWATRFDQRGQKTEICRSRNSEALEGASRLGEIC